MTVQTYVKCDNEQYQTNAKFDTREPVILTVIITVWGNAIQPPNKKKTPQFLFGGGVFIKGLKYKLTVSCLYDSIPINLNYKACIVSAFMSRGVGWGGGWW